MARDKKKRHRDLKRANKRNLKARQKILAAAFRNIFVKSGFLEN